MAKLKELVTAVERGGELTCFQGPTCAGSPETGRSDSHSNPGRQMPFFPLYREVSSETSTAQVAQLLFDPGLLGLMVLEKPCSLLRHTSWRSPSGLGRLQMGGVSGPF